MSPTPKSAKGAKMAASSSKETPKAGKAAPSSAPKPPRKTAGKSARATAALVPAANNDPVTRLYEAFQRKDGKAMAACYAADAQFSDPVFPDLRGGDAGAMWQMLCAGGKDLQVTFRDVVIAEDVAQAHWEATYTFSATGRKVHNVIEASFVLEDGRIVQHVDSFSFWRWSRQALGPVGWLLGWTPLVKSKVRKQAAARLASWKAKV